MKEEGKMFKTVISVDKELWSKFKAACALRKVTMLKRLAELIAKDLENNTN